MEFQLGPWARWYYVSDLRGEEEEEPKEERVCYEDRSELIEEVVFRLESPSEKSSDQPMLLMSLGMFVCQGDIHSLGDHSNRAYCVGGWF